MLELFKVYENQRNHFVSLGKIGVCQAHEWHVCQMASFEIRVVSNRILTFKNAEFDQETISVGHDFEGTRDGN